jgi:phage/plasmid-like protein (TIGR03299 family)
MAYAGEVPWHGLGVNVKDNMTPEQMQKAAKLDWTVSKRRMSFLRADGKTEEIKGEYALVRDSDEQVLTTVGATYKPVQNSQAFDFFKKFTKAGHMKMETAGSLWGGRYVWALARLGKDFSVGKTDEIRPYLLICSPHVHGRSLLMQYTAIRVVCWNTLTMAVGANVKGDGTGFRMPHSRDFSVEASVAEQALGLMVQQTDDFKEASNFLAKKKAKADEIDKFFLEVLRVKDDAKKTPIALPKFRAALNHAPGAQLSTAKGTWWGALNAVTYVIDHETGRERATSLRNAWVGHTAGIKRRALALALEKAK